MSNKTAMISLRKVAVFGMFTLLQVWAQVMPATAQPLADTKIPAEAFFGNAGIFESVLSPSGNLLAVATRNTGSRTGLFVFDLAGGRPVRRVAQMQDADVVSVRWMGEDRLLFSLVDYSEGSGRPNGAPGLFAAELGTGAVQMLIRRDRPRRFDTGGSLGTEYGLLNVPTVGQKRNPDELLVGRVMRIPQENPPTLFPFWFNVKTGSMRKPDFTVPVGTVSWLFDSAGEPHVAVTADAEKLTAFYRSPNEKGWQPLVSGTLLNMPFFPHVVDDAGNLYVTRKEGPEGQTVLVRYDFDSKAPEKAALVVTPGFDFEGNLILERGSGSAQGVRVNTDAESTVWFDETLKTIQTTVDVRFPSSINRISCRRCGTREAVVLIQSYSDQDPGRLWLYRPTPSEGQQQWQALAMVRDGIDPRNMARTDFHRITARDGRSIPVWVTLPKGVAPGKPAPTVVLVHGGPWVRGHRWGWEPMGQFLASRGYLVIEPEYRGSTGYGEAHFKAGWKQWGQAMQDDVADALLWARKEGLANDRACIAGGSYGGYSTLMGLVRHPDLYRCGAAWVAVTDLELYVSGSIWIRDNISDVARKFSTPQMVGSADTDAELISRNSPVLLASEIKAPLFLAFGEEDERVPLAHGKRLREALRKQSREPEWVTYPGEAHGWAMQETRLDFARRLETFLGKHLMTNSAQ